MKTKRAEKRRQENIRQDEEAGGRQEKTQGEGKTFDNSPKATPDTN
jgi:hypothetical protein